MQQLLWVQHKLLIHILHKCKNNSDDGHGEDSTEEQVAIDELETPRETESSTERILENEQEVVKRYTCGSFPDKEGAETEVESGESEEGELAA